MLGAIELNVGRSAESKLKFAPETFTVFVGPNGSGKSLLLREIASTIEGTGQATKLLGSLEIGPEDADDALRAIQARALHQASRPHGIRRFMINRHLPADGGVRNIAVDESQIRKTIELARQREAEGHAVKPFPLFRQLVEAFTLVLDGRNRAALVDPRPAGDLQQPPVNHLAALFLDRQTREKVREILHDALGRYFVLDPTNLGTLRIRLSARPPLDEAEEEGIQSAARAFHAAASDIAEESDGVKAFVGIITALVSDDFRIVIIDEPEAFLHPPLARKLGYQMARLSAARSGLVCAATHSAEFLMGAIEARCKLNVVRLTFERGIGAARLLPSGAIEELMRDPLMRSANVMSAVFHAGAVVCEGDVDRCFYQEISARLGPRGVRDSVFLNAQNKQTIQRIVGPLRRLGIPAAAVVDFDIIKKGGLKELLEACAVPPLTSHALGVLRGDLEAKFSGMPLAMKRGGLSVLSGDDAAACADFLAQLARFGIFVVPNGEVETWLAALGVAGEKKDWLPEMFLRLGSETVADAFVRPGSGDVWGFVEGISAWIADPQRAGMPE